MLNPLKEGGPTLLRHAPIKLCNDIDKLCNANQMVLSHIHLHCL